MLAGLLLSTFVSIPLAMILYGLESDISAWFNQEELAYANGLRLVQMFSAIGTFLLPSILLTKAFGTQIKYKKHTPVWVYLLGLVVMFCSIPISSLLSDFTADLPLPDLIAEYLNGQQLSSDQLLNQFLVMPGIGVMLFNFIVLAIIPAVSEELLFRSTLMPLFLQKFSHRSAIVFNGLFFALVHQQFLNLAGIFLLGTFLAWLWYRFRDIKLVIAMHLFNNGFLVLLVFSETNVENISFVWWQYLVCLTAIIASIVGLVNIKTV